MQEKKKPGPKKTEVGTQIQVRLLTELLEPLDRWIAQQSEPHPTRPEAIRRLVRAALKLDEQGGG